MTFAYKWIGVLLIQRLYDQDGRWPGNSIEQPYILQGRTDEDLGDVQESRQCDSLVLSQAIIIIIIILCTPTTAAGRVKDLPWATKTTNTHTEYRRWLGSSAAAAASCGRWVRHDSTGEFIARDCGIDASEEVQDDRPWRRWLVGWLVWSKSYLCISRSKSVRRKSTQGIGRRLLWHKMHWRGGAVVDFVCLLLVHRAQQQHVRSSSRRGAKQRSVYLPVRVQRIVRWN